MRPSVPLVGQLPLSIVITAGANLQGLDQMLLPVARQSALFLLIGAIIGSVVGPLVGRLMSPVEAAESEETPSATVSKVTHGSKKSKVRMIACPKCRAQQELDGDDYVGNFSTLCACAYALQV
jgi:hypothetical protein